MVKVVKTIFIGEQPRLQEAGPVLETIKSQHDQPEVNAAELAGKNLQSVRIAAAIAKLSCMLPVANVLSIGGNKRSGVSFRYKSWTFLLCAFGAIFLTAGIPTYMEERFPGDHMMGQNITTDEDDPEEQIYSLGDLQDYFFMNALRSVAIGQVGMNYILHTLMVARRFPALLQALDYSARLVQLPRKTIWILRTALVLGIIWFVASTASMAMVYIDPYSSLPEAIVVVYTFKYIYSTLLSYSLGAAAEVLFVTIALTLEQLISKNLKDLEEKIRYHRGMQEKDFGKLLETKAKAHFKFLEAVDKLSNTYCEYLSFNFVTNVVILGALLYFGVDAVLEEEGRHRIAVFFTSAFLVTGRMMISFEAGLRPQIVSHRMLKKISKAGSRVHSKVNQDKLNLFLLKAQLSPVQMFSAIWSPSPDAHRAGMLAVLNTAASGVAVLLQPKINSSG